MTLNVLGLLGSVAQQLNPPNGPWEWLLRTLSRAMPTYVWAIIVFTILLKLVLSPLDFFQKFKMKKNERITKKLQPEMDKLAKQYGDDKATLQQKQFQLQRAAGFSYFSTCIPMILTMVIFFTFFAGMRNISQFEEFSQYVNRYDIYVTRYASLTGLNMDGSDAGEPSADFDALINQWGLSLDGQALPQEQSAFNAFALTGSFKSFYDDYLNQAAKRNLINDNGILRVSDEYTYSIDIKTAGLYDTAKIYAFDYAAATQGQKDEFDVAVGRYLQAVNAKLAQFDSAGLVEPVANLQQFKQLYEQLKHYDKLTNTYIPIILQVAHDDAATMVYKDYKSKKPGFLWVKSIWAADVPWADAVPDYSKFRSSTSAYMINNKGKLSDADFNEVKQEQTYQRVMGKVIDDKSLSGTNGYLVLAVLAIAFALLSQVISTRQQKKSGTTMTANGTFKAMMYVMPIMIGVFAIISTAAFSIYMITNSVMTLLINLLTTFVMSKIFAKDKKEQVNSLGVIKYGRSDPNDRLKK